MFLVCVYCDGVGDDVLAEEDEQGVEGEGSEQQCLLCLLGADIMRWAWE